jgi:hypothetical protein
MRAPIAHCTITPLELSLTADASRASGRAFGILRRYFGVTRRSLWSRCSPNSAAMSARPPRNWARLEDAPRGTQGDRCLADGDQAGDADDACGARGVAPSVEHGGATSRSFRIGRCQKFAGTVEFKLAQSPGALREPP